MTTQKLVNREKELAFLEKKYKERPGFIIIYGRRRVGKTVLVEQFCEGKNSIYYTATETNKKEQIEEIFDLLFSHFKDNNIQDLKPSWETILRYLKGKNVIFTIDEFPYLIKADKSIPSKFQRTWDKDLKNSNIFLILTGSSISMMENKVLGHKSPLYGRRTGQWCLEPLKFKDASKFFSSYSIEDKIRTYSILGGIPYFLEQFDPDKGVFENVADKILSRGSILYQEVEFLLKEELREPRNYYTILKSISQGKTKFGEIINDTGISKNSLTTYLSVLRDLHLVEKRTPVTAKISKRGRYHLRDNFFKFWFRYILPNKSYLETDEKGVLSQIKSSFNNYVSFVFEEICKEFLTQMNKFPNIGKWWYKDNEIDIVGLNKHKNEILLGECKWTKKKMRKKVLTHLEETSKKVRWHNKQRKEHYALFSKTGFTKGLKKAAKDRKDVELYDLNRMEKAWGKA